MVNARIIDTLFGIDIQSGEMGVRFAFSYKENEEEKIVQTPSIKITSLDNITSLLKIAESQTWEGMIGRVIQIDIKDNELISIANIFDSDIQINFAKEQKQEEEELTNIEE